MKRFYLENTKEYISWLKRDKNITERILHIADLACDNTFIFTDKYEMERCTEEVRFDSQIDWNLIPFGDEEWCFAFSRHTFLLNLAKAYALTQNEKYRNAWIRLFEDFYDNTEPGERCWRTLECGIRIENYLRSIEYFNDANPLPSEVMEKLKAVFSSHIGVLKAAHTAFHKLSNWGVLQDHGLLLAAIYLDRKDDIKLALERLEEEAGLQTMNDGIHWEQSAMYHAEVLHAFLDSVLAARRSGIELSNKLLDKTHLLALGMARNLRPDGRCYLSSDSDEIDFRDMVLEAAVLFRDKELAAIGKGGNDEDFHSSFPLSVNIPECEENRKKSFFFADTGNAILALNDDTTLRFHCGLYGSGHGHFDQLHFDLYTKGEVLLTDTGRYTYVDGKERRQLKGAFGHNTIIINDKDMAKMCDSWGIEDFASPVFEDAKIEGPYKYLSAYHLGYMKDGVLPRRSIVTVEDKFVIIIDSVTAAGQYSAKSIFHADEGSVVTQSDDNTLCIQKNGAEIKMFFMKPGKTTLSTFPMSKHYNEMTASPLIERSFSHLAVTVIALERGTDIKETDVMKPLSSSVIDKDSSCGLMLSDGKDTYTFAFTTDEKPQGGFLLQCGDAECYARVFIKKNNEETVAIKY